MYDYTHTLPIKKSFHFPISGQNETINSFCGAEYIVSNYVLVFSQFQLLKQLLQTVFQSQILTEKAVWLGS